MDVILGGFPTQELEKNTDEKNNEVIQTAEKTVKPPLRLLDS